MAPEREQPIVWPTVPGGLTSTRDWHGVEALVWDLLAALARDRSPQEGERLTLSYIPFTDLGRSEGLDLSWEAQLAHGGDEVVSTGLGADPVDAVLDLGLVRYPHEAPQPDDAAAEPVLDVVPGAGGDLARASAGWSRDLRRAAEVAAAAPASPDEPSSAGFDLVVGWRPTTDAQAAGAEGEWSWEVTVEMLDEDGEGIGVVGWSAPTPAGALRAALDYADHWYRPWSAWPG